MAPFPASCAARTSYGPGCGCGYGSQSNRRGSGSRFPAPEGGTVHATTRDGRSGSSRHVVLRADGGLRARPRHRRPRTGWGRRRGAQRGERQKALSAGFGSIAAYRARRVSEVYMNEFAERSSSQGELHEPTVRGHGDSRLTSALEVYLAALDAGRPLPRDEFLAEFSEIRIELEECLEGLECGPSTGRGGRAAERSRRGHVRTTCAGRCCCRRRVSTSSSRPSLRAFASRATGRRRGTVRDARILQFRSQQLTRL